jgi:hypothetical protein
MLMKPTPLIIDKSSVNCTEEEFAENILLRLTDAKAIRLHEEPRWNESYGLWRNSNFDKAAMRGDAVTTAGTSSTWQHRVNTGKTYEVVETLVAYLKSATFPSDEWFEVVAKQPELGDILNLVQKAVKYKLDEAAITAKVEVYLRWLILFGTCTYRVTWESEVQRNTSRVFQPDGNSSVRVTNESTEELDIQVMSPFDVWLDIDEESTWARLRLSRSEFLELVHQGYYTVSDEAKAAYNPRKQTKSYRADSATNTDGKSEEIIEFYGDVVIRNVVYCNVHAVFLGDELIRLADSQYWCGSPYVSMSMFPDIHSPYGISMLHPNLGALHVTNVMSNLRLDNMLLHMHGMWEKVEDGVLNDDDLRVEPGKIFKVAQRGNMSRLDMGPPTFTVTYQEAATQEANIDRAMATGPLIGGAQSRGGDRVTAEEIIAVRDSGGNRLNLVHTHIEQMSTLPLLAKAFKLVQQYQSEDIIVTAMDTDVEMLAYYPVPAESFSLPLELLPIGANFVIETSRNLDKLLQVMDIAGRSPELSARVDHEQMLLEVMKQLRVDDPLRFIKKAEEQPPLPAMPQAPEMPEGMPPAGGMSIEDQAAMQTIATDGGEQLLNAAEIPTDGVPTDQLQQIMAGALTDDGQPI